MMISLWKHAVTTLCRVQISGRLRWRADVFEIKFENTQSLFQLGVGLSIALLYFNEYQFRICDQLLERLETVSDKVRQLTKFNTVRLTHANSTSVDVMNKDRRNRSFEQHDDLELIKKKLKLVQQTMWLHVQNLRTFTSVFQCLCFCLAIMSLTLLIISTAIPHKEFQASYVLLPSTAFLILTLMFVILIVVKTNRVERTYRRRYLRPGNRLNNKRSRLEPTGLEDIVHGDELGVVYYLERQIAYRLHSVDEYDVERYAPDETT